MKKILSAFVFAGIIATVFGGTVIDRSTKVEMAIADPIPAEKTAEKELRTYCRLSAECEGILKEAFESLRLSARARSRILKVARTIADLELSEEITAEHLYEAISYRTYGGEIE